MFYILWISVIRLIYCYPWDLTALLASDKSDNAFFKGPIQEVIFGPLGDDPICPVAALHAFLEVRPSTKASLPLSVNARGSPITPKVFNFMVRKVLFRLGFENVMLYSAKSFRVGAASETYSLGFSFDDVKGLGRWNSDAFVEYILSGARALRARRIHLKLADHHRSKRV